MAAELVMNKTMATKIATMSNVVRTRGRMPPATRSDRSSLDSVCTAIAAPIGSQPRERCHALSLMHQRYHDQAPGARPRGPRAAAPWPARDAELSSPQWERAVEYDANSADLPPLSCGVALIPNRLRRAD